MTYRVHVPGNGEPVRIHDTLEKAEQEANRLKEVTGKQVLIYAVHAVLNRKPKALKLKEAGMLHTVYFEWPEHIKGPVQVSRSAYNSQGGLIWQYQDYLTILDCYRVGGKVYANDPEDDDIPF